MKIVFLFANPRSTSGLSLDEEAREIQDLLRKSLLRAEISLITRWAVRRDDLLQIFNEEDPDIVHFSGHGTDASEICLQEPDGGHVALNSSVLSGLFSAFKSRIKLVFLNCCYSEQQARSIAAHINFVIGVRGPIEDTMAIKFASSFYRAIGFGHSVKDAHQQGLLAMAIARNFTFDPRLHTPLLIVRKGASSRNSLMSRYVNSSKPQNKRLTLVSDAEVRRFSDRGLGEEYLMGELRLYIIQQRLQVFTIVLFDIDKLTQINKVYSFEVGNHVLRRVSAILIEYVQDRFVGRRCGADTFFLLFPQIGAESATKLCSEFLDAVRRFNWEKYGAGLNVTVSFGVAAHRPGEPVEDTLVRAAIAMNQAKSERSGSLAEAHVAIGPEFLAKSQSRNLGDYYS